MRSIGEIDDDIAGWVDAQAKLAAVERDYSPEEFSRRMGEIHGKLVATYAERVEWCESVTHQRNRAPS